MVDLRFQRENNLEASCLLTLNLETVGAVETIARDMLAKVLWEGTRLSTRCVPCDGWCSH